MNYGKERLLVKAIFFAIYRLKKLMLIRIVDYDQRYSYDSLIGFQLSLWLSLAFKAPMGIIWLTLTYSVIFAHVYFIFITRTLLVASD